MELWSERATSYVMEYRFVCIQDIWRSTCASVLLMNELCHTSSYSAQNASCWGTMDQKFFIWIQHMWSYGPVVVFGVRSMCNLVESLCSFLLWLWYVKVNSRNCDSRTFCHHLSSSMFEYLFKSMILRHKRYTSNWARHIVSANVMRVWTWSSPKGW